MNTDLSNTQAQAVERLTRNIDRIHQQPGRAAFIHEYSSVVAVTIHFDNAPSIEKCFATENVDEINTFCVFLEGSKFPSEAQGSVTLKGVAA